MREDSHRDSTKAATCPVVGIGASAGGLEAIRQLFSNLPNDTGMAFVVIQHLDPSRPSMLATVLASDLRMPVVEVTHGMRAEPNRIHVIPPGADLSISQGILELVPRQLTHKLHLPIDSFFRSLANDRPGMAAGVVLSGSASDGTEGLRALKAAGGITFVQEPDSAQFRSMPESAIAAGVADFCLPPAGIATELSRLGPHPYLAQPQAVLISAGETDSRDEESLSSILAAVRKHVQLDFRDYKRPTVLRRIARRMALRGFDSLAEYAHALRTETSECESLAQDILIHVTSFFRDPAAFDAIEQKVLPELLERVADDGTLRVWVPGCSTGEEAYSLAICLLDALSSRGRGPAIKIFGSDLSDRAIESARAGRYAEPELTGVDPERVTKYFEREEGSYRIAKRVRDLCVFARQDLTRDPPFAKLDLISCRNVLIYFDSELQRKLLRMFHHCLNKQGYLFLGSSEAIGELGHLFVPTDKAHRIFTKIGESPRLDHPVALAGAGDARLVLPQPSQRQPPAREAQKQADHILLARYAPPGVVVNERLEVVQFRGRTGDFIEPPPGQPQTNLLKMARDGLVTHLRDALEMARKQSTTVRKEGVRLTSDARDRSVNLEVVPLASMSDAAERYFLVVFEEVARAPPAEGLQMSPAPARAVQREPDEEAVRLKAELGATRGYLQAISAEYQETAEELAAANEEMVATNEELQTTNEELQSAKEELQATNEELLTLNDELRSSNRQLDVVASDLVNVLESVQIPVIIVDQALRIRRFTPSAGQISSLRSADLGRSIDDVKLKVAVDDLTERIQEAITTIAPKEWQVRRSDGRWFRLNIRPYRGSDGRPDGAILSFLDVDALKHALQTAELARDFAQGIVETVPMALVVLDQSLRIVSANSPFFRSFGTSPNAAEKADFFALAAGAWHEPALRRATERCLTDLAPFSLLEARCTLPTTGVRDLLVSGSPLQGPNADRMVLLAMEDVTERRELELSESRARIDAEQANRAKDLFLATLSHELRTPLNAILMSSQVLSRAGQKDSKIQRASAVIERAVWNQVRLINDLLDISRIGSGKLMLELQAVDLVAVVQSAVDGARSAAEAKEIALDLSIQGAFGPIDGDPGRLQQVVSNLLDNAIKFTPNGGKISVRLEVKDGRIEIAISDTGAGLPGEIIPHIFDRFFQAERAMTRAHGGLGLGLAIVRHIVEAHGGEVRAESPGEGEGSTFKVTLPLARSVDATMFGDQAGVAGDIRDIRVLLVEDDEDTRVACAELLQELGADVRAARSAAEGLAALETFAPQVILCDIAMPGEDGYAFIRNLRSSATGAKTPVVALTALASEEDRRRVLDAGFQVHLQKPIDSDRLAMVIGNLSAAPSS